MKVQGYLVVNSKGSMRVMKTKPGLGWNEISIAINLELPDALFKKPSLHAEIKIPDSAASPSEVTAEITDNIKAAIEQAAGMEVRLTIVEPEKP